MVIDVPKESIDAAEFDIRLYGSDEAARWLQALFFDALGLGRHEGSGKKGVMTAKLERQKMEGEEGDVGGRSVCIFVSGVATSFYSLHVLKSQSWEGRRYGPRQMVTCGRMPSSWDEARRTFRQVAGICRGALCSVEASRVVSEQAQS